MRAKGDAINNYDGAVGKTGMLLGKIGTEGHLGGAVSDLPVSLQILVFMSAPAAAIGSA